MSEQEDIMQIKRLVVKVSKGEKQLPKLGTDKRMCNTICVVTARKTASSALRTKPGSSAPMITYGTHMGERNCVSKFPRGSPIIHNDAIDDGAGYSFIKAHL